MRLLIRAPERSFYVRELVRLGNLHLNAVRRELSNLERLGLVVSLPPAERGDDFAGSGGERAKYFRINTTALLFPELTALINKSQVVEEEELVSTLKNRGGNVRLFILTGLFTGAAEAPTDLLLVGALKPVVIARAIRAYEQESGQVVRYTLLSDREFRERRELGDKFLYSVFESKHLPLVNEYTPRPL